MGSVNRKVALVCVMGLLLLLVGGCAEPLVIVREAQPAAVVDPSWQLLWKNLHQEEQSRTVAGREITVRAGSHVALWGREMRSAIVMATTPELLVFGQDVNPVRQFDDEALVTFAVDMALKQVGSVVGMPVPTQLALQHEKEIAIETSYGRLAGTQFAVTAKEGAFTLLILRTRSGADHVIVLGLLPSPLNPAQLESLIGAVKSSQHPATLGTPVL